MIFLCPWRKSKIEQLGSLGGNHKHPGIEWFIGIGELELIWLDESGKKHTTHMNPNGQILLFEMPPFVPHAVKNISDAQRGMLIEFADGKMLDVEVVKME